MRALFRRVFFCVHLGRGFLSAFYPRRFFRAVLRWVFPVRSSPDFFRAFFAGTLPVCSLAGAFSVRYSTDTFLMHSVTVAYSLRSFE